MSEISEHTPDEKLLRMAAQIAALRKYRQKR